MIKKTLNHAANLKQSGKEDSFRHILKDLFSTYERSDSQFFQTTTGIQSGPEAFDESRLVTTFLNNLGVTEKLYSFRLVLKRKTGKEIHESSRLD